MYLGQGIWRKIKLPASVLAFAMRVLLKLRVLLHFVVFGISIYAIWFHKHKAYLDFAIMLLVLLYIAWANLKRREIMPSILIMIAFSVTQIIVTPWLYSRHISFLMHYLATEAIIYGAFSYLLFKYHCSPTLLSFIKSDIRKSYIPQSVAMSSLLFFSAWIPGLAFAEVFCYRVFDGAIFTEAPIFYSNYPTAKGISFSMMMIGVWSMMIDAHLMRVRLSKVKDAPNKT